MQALQERGSNVVTYGDEKMLKPGRWRKTEEVKSIADKVAQNTELMERLRSILGSGDRDLASEIINQISIYAQRFDPTFGLAEGTEIAMMLVQRLHESKGSQGTK
jgi:hypothetical protein